MTNKIFDGRKANKRVRMEKTKKVSDLNNKLKTKENGGRQNERKHITNGGITNERKQGQKHG